MRAGCSLDVARVRVLEEAAGSSPAVKCAVVTAWVFASLSCGSPRAVSLAICRLAIVPHGNARALPGDGCEGTPLSIDACIVGECVGAGGGRRRSSIARSGSRCMVSHWMLAVEFEWLWNVRCEGHERKATRRLAAISGVELAIYAREKHVAFD